MIPPPATDAPAPPTPARAAEGAAPAPRPRAGLAVRVAGMVTGLALVAAAAFAVTVRIGTVGDAARAARLPPSPAGASATTPLPLPAVAAAARTRVVAVEVDTDRGERFGTGWVLDSAGDVVTNNHVVERARAVRLVERGGAVHTAVVVGVDAVQDVAVIRATDGLAVAPLPIARTQPSLEQAVVVLASARATMHGEITLETVRRLHDSITVNPDLGQPGGVDVEYSDMLVLRGAPVFQGNSGGPVLDDLGRVVGIVTATSATLPEAYAIPIGRVLPELLSFAGRDPSG